jgi:hypothetical protein
MSEIMTPAAHETEGAEKTDRSTHAPFSNV